VRLYLTVSGTKVLYSNLVCGWWVLKAENRNRKRIDQITPLFTRRVGRHGKDEDIVGHECMLLVELRAARASHWADMNWLWSDAEEAIVHSGLAQLRSINSSVSPYCG
jgi:hypothetical protein